MLGALWEMTRKFAGSTMTSKVAPPIERIESRILLTRGRKVLLDADLAELYDVETRTLNQAVKRNSERFPQDFMFRLTAKELENWRSQTVMSNPAAKMGLRRAPLAFTEHGALMAATVLNSPRAVEVSLHVVRAFVQLRETLASHKDLARRLDALERRYDRQFKVVFDAIRELMTPPPAPKKRGIGFVSPD